MSSQAENVLLLLCVTFVTQSLGLQLSMDTTPNINYCGHLHCWADKNITEKNIKSIVRLVIYDITQTERIKLASLSVFDSDVCGLTSTNTGINATGNVSSNHAEITVGLRDTSYCLTRSFLCELDVVNIRGDIEVIRKSVSLGNSEECNDANKENIELRHQNNALKAEINRLQEIVNTWSNISQTNTNVMCFKGMPHCNHREPFLLWGQVQTLCDTETDGGGWTVIQRRTKGDVDFYRNWNDYKNGFGSPDTDFWIGNDIIHNLTSQNYTELRIDMEYQGRQYYAQYSHFTVDNETSLYRLSVSGYKGTAGDYFSYNNGYAFTTFDKDNDMWYGSNCASYYHGAWWYYSSTRCNLNGMWGARNYSGVSWYGIVSSASVSVSEMKIRLV